MKVNLILRFVSLVAIGFLIYAPVYEVKAEPIFEGCDAAKPKMRSLSEIAEAAQLIFVGEVVELGSPPHFESSMVLPFQEVTYRIDEVLKADPRQESLNTEIKVHHFLLRGARNTVVINGVLQLPPECYSVGPKIIVMAEMYYPKNHLWREMAGASDLGVVLATEKNRARILKKTEQVK
ncbi:MAG: hypothetical protein K0U66_00210 [Gammaproteobacteria bacterium]|nr:hypothetical protein [Gammaproteobacteria bacterium]